MAYNPSPPTNLKSSFLRVELSIRTNESINLECMHPSEWTYESSRATHLSGNSIKKSHSNCDSPQEPAEPLPSKMITLNILTKKHWIMGNTVSYTGQQDIQLHCHYSFFGKKLILLTASDQKSCTKVLGEYTKSPKGQLDGGVNNSIATVMQLNHLIHITKIRQMKTRYLLKRKRRHS